MTTITPTQVADAIMTSTFPSAADIRSSFSSCECPSDASGPWDCCDCPVHGEEACAEMEAQYKSEMAAENAWLHHAENQGWNDDPRGD
jgi:hypothetical protein